MIEKLRNSWMIYSKEYYKFKDVGIFIALLLVFTVLGYLWKLTGYRIFGIAVLEPTYAVLIKAVLISSGELLQHVFNLNVIVERVTNRIYLSQDSYVYIYNGCSGLKEMAMFLFIMALFPGPWKSKLWFIPLSLVIIFIVVILRVVALILLFKYHPGQYSLFHDFLLNYLFFGIFFILWLFWVKFYYLKLRRPGKPEPS
jgi:exosortase/archaeosortase family protein